MMNLPEKLRARLQTRLPGQEAHQRMAPPGRLPFMEAPPNARQGGVMILLFHQENDWHTLLIRRTEDGHVHSGQISFPGGRFEAGDPDIRFTALRECEEEIGIPYKQISVIGTLSPIYIPPSNFLVTPTLGLLESLPPLSPSTLEVQEVIPLSLAQLFSPENRHVREIFIPGRSIDKLLTPVFLPQPSVLIWGATAMILSELQALLEQE